MKQLPGLAVAALILVGSPALAQGTVPYGRRKGQPRIFIAHGVKDSTMPVDVSGRRNVQLLEKDGYDVTYREHAGGHGTPREIVRESMQWFLPGKAQR